MLNNQNWDKPKVKHDAHSLVSLIDWLETKNPDQSYTYCSSTKCLCAQYYRAKGYWFIQMSAFYFFHGFFESTRLPDGFNLIAAQKPHTFGAALQRARVYAESQQ